MSIDQRIKGQEISLRVISGGQVVSEVNSVSAFNEAVALALKEAGYLGELVNRFDEILDGYGGDMDMNVTRASWLNFQLAVEARARREQPDLKFNVVRADLYPNGDNATFTYRDVHFGPMPTNIPSRGDYVKVHLEFKCSERAVAINALP